MCCKTTVSNAIKEVIKRCVPSKKYKVSGDYQYKLTLNLSKSNMILIQPKNLNNKVKSSAITSNFVPEISTINSLKYLGVLLDNSSTV